MLKTKNGLTQQIEAAKTLHLWGLKESNKEKLIMAMMGTMKVDNPKTNRKSNLIWGWRRLVEYTRGKEAAQDAFRECVFHSIQCRFRYGKLDKTKKGPEAINSAKKELEKKLNRYDFLKQGAWAAKFDNLLKEINAAL